MKKETRRYICRKETFGGLLYDRINSNSIYISEDEFTHLYDLGFVFLDGKKIISSEVRFVFNNILPHNTFSAPDGIYFEITRKCNLRCIHCLNDSGFCLKSEWSWDFMEELFNRFYQIGVTSVRLTGGEPFCSDYIFQALKLLDYLGITTTIGSNGTLITSDIAKELSNLGVSLVIVSLDGLKELNDSIRGKGSFDKAIKGIEHLINNGIKTRINVVVTKGIIDDITGLIDIANNLQTDIVIRRLITIGRAKKEQMLKPEEYNLLLNLISQKRLESKVNIFSHYDYHIEKKPRIPISFYSSKCSCGSRGIGILPNGDVYACGFLAPLGETFKAGNVYNEDILDIWINSTVLKKQRDNSQFSFCRIGCSKKDYCKGSCPVLLNNFNDEDPYCLIFNRK